MFLCLAATARAQADYEYRYWFDTAHGETRTGRSATKAWHMEVPTDGLSLGMHTLHVQVKDTAQAWSAPVSRTFLKTSGPTGLACRYWFDADKGEHGTASAWGRGAFPLDVAGLCDGMHSVHFQVEDAEKSAPSVPVTSTFLKTRNGAGLVCRYWFDDDKSEPLVVPTWGQGAFPVDVSHLEDGIHSVHFQVDGQGAPTLPTTNLFLKIPPTEGVDYMLCVADIDEKPFRQERVPASGGVVNWSLDVTALAPGLHRMQVRVVTPTGAASSVSDHFFFRTTTSQEMAAMKCYYSIDGETVLSQAGTYGKGLFHFDVDVAGLEDGLHRIAYFLSSETGGSTRLNAAWFVKTPLGGNGIARYDYWLNEQTETAHRVELSARRNPFDLVSLLPVESVPVRSSSFQFELEDGHPVLYARNDLHVRFYDAAGRFTDMTRSYADYKVSRRVEDIYPLVSGQQVSKPCPAENGILWYRLDAATGDSLSFRTTQAASVQLFSPSGREVYSASGAASVAFGGCHAWEDGTYYLAVHDVTGTRSTTIGVDYVHIDKYAVLRYDVHRTGNGGYTTIALDGNGFDYLDSVKLVGLAETDSIACTDIKRISDNKIEATFDFHGAAPGPYDMVFHFIDEDRIVDDGIVVEEATDIKLNTKVTYPQQFLRNTNVSYDIKITNEGNNTAYRIPVYVYIASHTQEGIKHIKLSGIEVPGIFDDLDFSEYTPTEKAEWMNYAEEQGDEHIFIRQYVKNDSGDDSIYVRSGYIFVNVAPCSTKEIKVTMKANQTVELWATVPSDWDAFYDKEDVNLMAAYGPRRIRRNAMEQYCCVHERVECVASIIGDGIGFANKIASLTGLPQAKALGIAECVSGLVNKTIQAVGSVFCNKEEVEENFWQRVNKIASAIDISSVSASCVKSVLPKFDIQMWEDINDAIGAFGLGHLSTVGGCVTAFSKPIVNCPPEPPGGGSSEAVNSLDPNDIYGYLAESGSRYIKKGVRQLNYTIEFENSPDFATASAHEVVVTDTLDGRRFDLSSFAPTSLKISDRIVELDGEPSFVRTVDMRPEINAIAQVECDFDARTGIALWYFSSLDPMTMEPTDNPMSGFLAVNTDEGNGIGEVSFNIDLKREFDDGCEIANRASIVFDLNEPILTPTWTNVVDTVAPVSALTGGVVKNDSILTLTWRGEDNRSGLWRYDLYVQDGAGASWRKAAENVTDTLCDFRYYEGMNYGFCVVATDSAGNVERKELAREFTLESFKPGDANGDGKVDALDVTLVVQYYLTKRTPLNLEAANVVRDGVIDALDITRIQQIHLKGNSRIKKRMRRRMYETK